MAGHEEGIEEGRLQSKERWRIRKRHDCRDIDPKAKL